MNVSSYFPHIKYLFYTFYTFYTLYIYLKIDQGANNNKAQLKIYTL